MTACFVRFSPLTEMGSEDSQLFSAVLPPLQSFPRSGIAHLPLSPASDALLPVCTIILPTNLHTDATVWEGEGGEGNAAFIPKLPFCPSQMEDDVEVELELEKQLSLAREMF